jgi:hypothetical protein
MANELFLLENHNRMLSLLASPPYVSHATTRHALQQIEELAKKSAAQLAIILYFKPNAAIDKLTTSARRTQAISAPKVLTLTSGIRGGLSPQTTEGAVFEKTIPPYGRCYFQYSNPKPPYLGKLWQQTK